MNVTERIRKLDALKTQDRTQKQLYHGHRWVPLRPTGSLETSEQLHHRIGNNRNFGKIYGKDQTGFTFTQNQDNYAKDKKKTNRKGEYYCFHCVNQGNWAAECPDLKAEQQGKLHTTIGIVKDDVDEEGNTTSVRFFEMYQKTKKRKTLDPNKNYLEICSTYNKLT